MKGRVAQLPATYKLRDEVVALTRLGEVSEFPALSKRIVTVMERKPPIPLRLFAELLQAKQRIDEINAREERRLLPEAFNTFFEVFAAVKGDKKGGKAIIQKAIGSFPKEVKDKIYGKIFAADKPKTKDPLYGEKHVVDSLTRLQRIVEEVRVEILEAEDDDRFAPHFPLSSHFSGHDSLSFGRTQPFGSASFSRGPLPLSGHSAVEDDLGGQLPLSFSSPTPFTQAQLGSSARCGSVLPRLQDFDDELLVSPPVQQAPPVEGNEAYYLTMMHKACKKGNIDSIRELMQKDFDKMPLKLRNEIYAAISQDAGRSKTDLKFGKENLYADRARFARVVEKRADVQAQMKLLASSESSQPRLRGSSDELELDDSHLEHKSALHHSVVHHDEPLELNRHQQIEQLRAHLDVMMRDQALMGNKPKRLDALHKLFNEVSDREFKLEIYREIGKVAKKSGSSAEQYGRDHFADDFGALRKILQVQFEKAILAAAELEDEF